MTHDRVWDEAAVAQVILSLSTSEATEQHLTREEAFDYLCELLTPDATRRIQEHLLFCQRCTLALQRMDADAGQIDVSPVVARITVRVQEERGKLTGHRAETFLDWLKRIASPAPSGVYAEGDQEDEECEVSCNLQEIRVKALTSAGELYLFIECMPDHLAEYRESVVTIPYKDDAALPLRIRVGVPESVSVRDLTELAFDKMAFVKTND